MYIGLTILLIYVPYSFVKLLRASLCVEVGKVTEHFQSNHH